MKRLRFSFERVDAIELLVVDDDTLEGLGELELPGRRLFVFIDTEVRRLWGQPIDRQFARYGRDVFWFDVEATEASKSLPAYPRVVDFLEHHGAGRFDLLVAVGGGIVQDLVAFVASTYMRGLPLFAVPTTLIGQVDAVTAGKTCLNTGGTKNALGTFYYPQLVYNNIAFLGTNAGRHLRQGFAEAFKYALLAAPDLVDILRSYRSEPSAETLARLVERAIEARVAVRRVDPLASNLGHTFGHALEKLSGYEILHGDAISAGTVMAVHFARQQGVMDESAGDRVIELMRELGLNTSFERTVDAEQMTQLMLRDKKSASDEIFLVLLQDIGIPYRRDGDSFYPVQPEAMRSFLADYIANSGFGVANCAELLQTDTLGDAP